MGSGISSNNKKKKNYYGSAIFGYKSTSTLVKSSCTLYLPIAADIDNDNSSKRINNNSDDNVLYQPSLYGLGATANHSTFSQLSTLTAATVIDCSGNSNSQLYKDLIYVDKTYYSNEKEQQYHLFIKQQQQQKEEAERALLKQQRGDAITFHDIIQIYQQSMQNIDLSKKGLESITSSIGLLSMIKKLDL